MKGPKTCLPGGTTFDPKRVHFWVPSEMYLLCARVQNWALSILNLVPPWGLVCFFSVRRLLGFRQVVAQVRPCHERIAETCWASALGGIKREQVGPYTVQCLSMYDARQPKQEKQKNRHKTQNQNKNNKQQKHSKQNEEPSSCWTEVLYAN